MLKIITTLFTILILSTNAIHTPSSNQKEYIEGLTLEDISGKWELRMFSEFFTHFDAITGALTFSCSNILTQKCRNTLPDEIAIIKMDHVTNSYESSFVLFPGILNYIFTILHFYN